MIQNQDFFAFIASNSNMHSRTSDWWTKYSDLFSIEIQNLHSSTKDSLALGEIGLIEFPYVSFGSINTTHLFGLDELIIFSWYFKNKNKYVKVLDLGANVGLHSLMMSKFGFSVDAYEPDHKHFGLLEKVVSLNPTMGGGSGAPTRC